MKLGFNVQRNLTTLAKKGHLSLNHYFLFNSLIKRNTQL